MCCDPIEPRAPNRNNSEGSFDVCYSIVFGTGTALRCCVSTISIFFKKLFFKIHAVTTHLYFKGLNVKSSLEVSNYTVEFGQHASQVWNYIHDFVAEDSILRH